MTSNAPSRMRADASGEPMSATCNAAPSATFSRFPDDRLSTMETAYPRLSRSSATWEPMKPAPPVTSARRLMRRLGLEAIAPKPRTSQPSAEHKKYPYLLRDLPVTRPDGVALVHVQIRLKGRGKAG